jgi:endonuclease/exonuclease/phosphatase family metal-dependent hydrolase
MTSPIKNTFRRIATGILAISGLILLFLAAFLIFATLTDYKPGMKESIAIPKTTLPNTIPAGRLKLYSWNIGYCGLGAKMDFFYEGGTMVRPEKEYYEQCRDGVIKQLLKFNEPDFILLQEVDRKSARTYRDDQVEHITTALKEYTGLFALNYKVPFVPVPPTSPMGKVLSGILLLSRYQPTEVIRYQFPSAYSWPKRLFMLDRCFILSRYNMSNGKQLVLLNTHNSAYADAADMRARELAMFKDVIVSEYDKGNYVIAGGDWNQNPGPYDKNQVHDGNIAYTISPGIPDYFLPAGFSWAFDPNRATNRDVDKPYIKGETPTTVIDFFILSPNVSLISATTVQNNFEFADHQPVEIEVELK